MVGGWGCRGDKGLRLAAVLRRVYSFARRRSLRCRSRLQAGFDPLVVSLFVVAAAALAAVCALRNGLWRRRRAGFDSDRRCLDHRIRWPRLAPGRLMVQRHMGCCFRTRSDCHTPLEAVRSLSGRRIRRAEPPFSRYGRVDQLPVDRQDCYDMVGVVHNHQGLVWHRDRFQEELHKGCLWVERGTWTWIGRRRGASAWSLLNLRFCLSSRCQVFSFLDGVL